jgi:ribose transport system ATP-binding protein
MSDLILEMDGIAKSYGGIEVLHGVHFDLYSGEVHAVIGQNGAGKSTLMKILNGVTVRDGGTIRLDGREVLYGSPIEARKHGIGMIFQEFSLVPSLTVSQNVFLAKEPRIRALILNDKKCEERTASLLHEIGADDINPRQLICDLSTGSQQMVEIAKALSSESRIVIMDEPTASLSHKEIEKLFKVIGKLTEKGISIIYVSHYLQDIFKICNRITVLRDGNRISTKDVSETTMEETINDMLGERLIAKRTRTRPSDEKAADTLLEIKDLSVGKHVRNVSFTLRRGEILGIAGLLGSGRSEIVGAIYGVLKKSSGEILIRGNKTNIRSPRDAIKHGIAMVPEDRRKQGLVMSFSIKENMIFPILSKILKYRLIRDREGLKIINGFMEKMSIKAAGPWQIVKSLSGGNQQKVVVAKSMMSDSSILFLDDPTFGIDIQSKQEIMNSVSEFADAGNGVVFISSELDEIVSYCDRIIILKKGEITDMLDCNKRSDISEELLTKMIQ